jgi:membrane-bound serine protease (ClpP class)
MFILEIKVTSYGMLTVGGAISLIVGAWMLVDGPIPELRVPLEVVLPTGLAIVAFVSFAVRLAVRAQREQVATGGEGLSDETGTVTRTLDPEGKVFVHGEIWNAASAGGRIPKGARVRVVEVNEMHLTVEPVGPRRDEPNVEER